MLLARKASDDVIFSNCFKPVVPGYLDLGVLCDCSEQHVGRFWNGNLVNRNLFLLLEGLAGFLGGPLLGQDMDVPETWKYCMPAMSERKQCSESALPDLPLHSPPSSLLPWFSISGVVMTLVNYLWYKGWQACFMEINDKTHSNFRWNSTSSAV